MEDADNNSVGEVDRGMDVPEYAEVCPLKPRWK
jgi:hypothetical protein